MRKYLIFVFLFVGGFLCGFIVSSNLVDAYFLPTDSYKIEEAVKNAGSSIYIMTYSLYPNPLAFEIMKKARKGVDVRIIVNSKAYHKEFLEEMKNAGVKIKLMENVHAKVYIIDRSKVFVGSNNLSNAALKKNVEAGIYLQFLEVGEVLKFFETVWDYENSTVRS